MFLVAPSATISLQIGVGMARSAPIVREVDGFATPCEIKVSRLKCSEFSIGEDVDILFWPVRLIGLTPMSEFSCTGPRKEKSDAFLFNEAMDLVQQERQALNLHR